MELKGLEIKPLDWNGAVPYSLLLEADPSREKVDSNLQKGDCYVAVIEERTVGVAVLVPINENETELVNLAVSEEFRGKGIAKKLIFFCLDVCKNKQIAEVFVGTGNSSLSQLGLYQKCGFRMDHILKDYFIEHYQDEIVENGIQCRDMIVLKQSIKMPVPTAFRRWEQV
ncbi:GNAT family N-acetyltransferase [Metabacillus herbersteinensis]|uniref:GNAT family N-acetyltransferase n=1 Tax=Metabacillus herbersteinensis TaxID=283816 RepID=A0ABV6GB82_9BACI